MATLLLDRQRLQINARQLEHIVHSANAEWALVTKLLCGHADVLREVLATGVKAVCDSRLSNLRMVQRLAPDVGRIYIKPPPRNAIHGVVETAHVSCNTESRTLEWLNEAAGALGTQHGVLIMVEGGDLREGVTNTSTLLSVCETAESAPNLHLLGLGTNFNCLSGVLPTAEAMHRLLQQQQIVEEHLGRELQWMSAGSSVVLPMLLRGDVPSGLDHFRIGESFFFGNDLIDGSTLPGMERDVFVLEAEIIEIGEKPSGPSGPMQAPPSGDPPAITKPAHELSTRAIVDVGLLDIGKAEYLQPMDEGVSIVGASSDMLVVDVTDAAERYTVGSTISFHVGYMATLSIMNSDYVHKRVVSSHQEVSTNTGPSALRKAL